MELKLCLGCMEKYGKQFEVCPHCGYVEGTAPKEAYHLAPGTILQDKYIVGRVVGYGGFGVTYIGYNMLLEQKVAIKEYLPGEFATRCSGESQVTIFSGESEEQFADGIVKYIEEARRLAKFKNTPGIVSIHDSFTANKTAYIVMEYLEGETLKEKLKREGKLSVEDSLNIIMPVLSALKQVHKEGILHRDISPDNIFITNEGEVKLLDFGAARYATTTHSKSLSVIVKPGYAPQEQYRSRGDQGSWTDVYACAATLYKMITGVTPEDSMERGNKDTLVPPSKHGIKIDKNKENAIMNALNLKIEDRTQTAEAFETDLTTDNTVKRNKIKMKKADIGKWPLWLKITSGTLATAIVAFVVLLLTGVINLGSINIFDKGELEEGKVYVPNVVNYELPDAEKKITDSKLVLQIVDKQNSDVIPKDMVLSQNIIDGEVVQEGTVLELVISAGGEIVYMPDLTGMKWEEAETALNAMGLVGIKTEEKNEMAPGYVFDQNVAEGEPVEKGTTITIYVSIGMDDIDENAMTTVPNVEGETLTNARSIMLDAKLYIYVLSTEYSNTVPKGEIISQNVAAGSEVNQGTEIGVIVSAGKEMVRVPDVQYKSLSEAKQILSGSNLKYSVVYQDSSTVAKDHVISQGTTAGTEVAPQTVITIYVSKGNPAADNAPTYQPSTNTESNTSSNTTTSTESPANDADEDTNVNGDEENNNTPTTTEPPIQVEPDDGNIAVPNLVGMNETEAKNALSNANLKVGEISYKSNANKTAGTVLSQGVSAGTKVAKNSTINIVVCNNDTYTEYRYRDKKYTTSTNSTLDGWTMYDMSENWSSWSDWSTTPTYENEYTEVKTESRKTPHPGNPGAPLPVPTRIYSSYDGTYDEVKWIQTFLNISLGAGLVVDGKYGASTINAVYKYQRAVGIKDDGSVGPTTTAQMLLDWQTNYAYSMTTYYSYRTCTYTYYYEKWEEWSSWSTTKATATDTRQVETREVYIY